MYLKSLSVSRTDLVKALEEVYYGGQRLADPDFRIDGEYKHAKYPGRTFLAVLLPPDNAVRTQFFKELAHVIGIDEAMRLVHRSRTENGKADMVIYFPDVTLLVRPKSKSEADLADVA